MIKLLLDALPRKQKALTINGAEGARSAADVLNRIGCKERLLGRPARVLEGMNGCSPSSENHSSLFSDGKRIIPSQHTTEFPPVGLTRTCQVSSSHIPTTARQAGGQPICDRNLAMDGLHILAVRMTDSLSPPGVP